GFAVTVLAIGVNAYAFNVPFPYGAKQVLIHFVPGLRDLMWSTSIDGIVWTLEIELKFYLVAAFIAPWLARGSLFSFLVPLAIMAGLVACPTLPSPGPIAAMWLAAPFLIFMFVGVALNFWYRGLQSTMATILVCVSLMIGCGHSVGFVSHGIGVF